MSSEVKQLRQYQKDAIDFMVKDCERLLDQNSSKPLEFILMAPTGSGKTIICGSFLQEWVKPENTKHDLSFIWIAPNKLHNQSKDKIEDLYKDNRTLECLDEEDLDTQLEHKDIFFTNWPSINKPTNNLRKDDRENGRSLVKISNNTKNYGNKLVLILDEGHNSAGGYAAREVIGLVNPDLIIFVSATAGKLLPGDGRHIIDHTTVVTEQMITKSIKCNPPDVPKNKKLSDRTILDLSIARREQLVKAFEKQAQKGENPVNPLLLIQIPDKTKGQVLQRLQLDIEIYLKTKYDITYDNGKLAIYLSDDEDKINLENIEKNDNPVEVMIFKQAPSLGWDCPRASVLCLFRNLENITFGIQIFGRLMRMPNLHHYTNHKLNHGYVYYNFSNIIIHPDLEAYVQRDFEAPSKIINKYPISLPKTPLIRNSKKMTLDSIDFYDIFNKKKIQNDFSTIKIRNYKLLSQQVTINLDIDDLDKITTEIVAKSTSKIPASDSTINTIFEKIISNIQRRFTIQSIHAIKNALYASFYENFSHNFESDLLKIQKIVTSPDNVDIIKSCFEQAGNEYEKLYTNPANKPKKGPMEPWAIPSDVPIRGKKKKMKKCIIKNFDFDSNNKLEKKFMNKLENSKNVRWWYRNADKGSEHFSIIYGDQEFYPDFIVLFNDMRVGIYDTKGFGEIAKPDTKAKAIALKNYIKAVNKNPNTKLEGGIIADTNANSTGTLKINTNANAVLFDKNKISTWDNLQF